MASFSSTPDSACEREWKYDVFLSYRGEDTGKTFTDHLYKALDEKRFYAFRDDDNHEKEKEIAPEFLTAIEESKISILVFSKNYAHSRCCLDELETIVKSMKEPRRIVVPVFYHVNPSNVRDQIGSGEVFLSHEIDAEERKEKVNRWRAALREASNLVGWHLQNQYESQLIKEIIADVLRRLDCELLQVDYDTVGMEFHLKKLLKLMKLKLDKVLMIGIYGISGIGKTTIAKAIYNKISYHFESTIFSRGHDLNEAQFKKLDDKRVLFVVDDVDQLSQVEYLVILRDSFSLRSRIIFTTRDRRLLDAAEVDAPYEASGLTHEEAIHLLSWHAFKQTFPKEGYVQLVNHVVGYAKGHPLALKVLGSSLFGKTIPKWERILLELGKSMHGEIYNVFKVSFDGLTPTEQEIFLKVVCLLKGKDEEFVSTIQDSVTLGAENGIQFLHDKCLATISDNKLYMHDLLQHMGQKLICESNPQKLGQRGRLQDPEDVYPSKRNKGTQEIQRIQSSSADFQEMIKLYSPMHCPFESLPPNLPGDSLSFLDLSYSNIRQLWEGKKIFDKLTDINLSFSQNLVEIPTFSSLPALRILTLKGCKKLRSLPSSISEWKCLERLCCSGCSTLKAFPEITEKMKILKELHLDGTAIKELPSSIENLTALEVLNLARCKILASLPSGISEFKCLERLCCSGCSTLNAFPEITEKMENLKELHLDETAIEELPSSIENLTALEVLNLARCEILASLPSGISELKCLQRLCCSGCSNLEAFPEITDKMENLKELHLDETAIKELPTSIENLTALEVLNLKGFNKLASLRSGISDLKHLQSRRRNHLKHLQTPSNLERFPEIKGKMENLKELHLAWTSIEELPSSIENVTALKVLNLEGCRRLASLPSGISELKHLRSLRCTDCSKLERFPEITGKMENLKELHLDGTAIKELPSSIENLTALEVLNLARCKILASLPSGISELKCLERLCCSGCSTLNAFPEITEKMENLKELHFDGTAIEELPSSIKNLTALEVLNLARCKILASLPSGISELKCLQRLCCSGCSNLEAFPEITEKMENLKELHLDETAIKELPSSIENLTALEVLNLKGFNRLASLRSGISDLKHLQSRRRTHFSNLERFPEIKGKMENLKELHLDWTSIEELPSSIENLTALKVLNLEGCRRLASLPSGISELKHLRSLRCTDCSKLERFPEITGKMENLKELHLDWTSIEELPSSIENLTALKVLNLEGCRRLASLPSGISELKHLRSLRCTDCSKLERFPEITGKMENLKELHLDGAAIKELPSSIENLTALEVLNLARCKILASLPSGISELKCLERLCCSGCSTLNAFPEITEKMENLKELHFDGTAIEELPSSIENLTALEVLNLARCKILASLPSGISELKCLQRLCCSGCSNLEAFPEITEKMENLKELHLDETAIKELPSSIENLTALEVLNLKGFNRLASLRSGFSDLKHLQSRQRTHFSNLERFPEIKGKMENLKELHLDWTSIEELPSSIENLTALKVLNLEGCRRLASLPSGISELKHLRSLWCTDCSKLERFPEIIGKMENLKELHLDGTAIKELPSSIENLTALEVLNLARCKILASLSSGISELKHLQSFRCTDCSKLERFPEITGKMENLKELHLDKTAIEELPSSIENLTALEVLNLEGCRRLASLPSGISELKHLRSLRCTDCSKLKRFLDITGKMENLEELHFDWTSIEELPSSIENLTALKVLNLEGCRRLASLPSGISELKHLQSLRCTNCSNLERFPEITGKMENLKELHLDKTTIEELPSSIENLTALEVLNLEYCESLASLPSGISELKHLRSLRCSHCSKLERFPEITGKMENLKELHLDRTAIKELPASIENLTALEVLNLNFSKSLASLPSVISEMKHLKRLWCSGCSSLKSCPEVPRRRNI